MRKPGSKKSGYAPNSMTSNVIDIAKKQSERAYRIERSHGPIPFLKLIVPFKERLGREESIDLTYLLKAPYLEEAFATSLCEISRMACSPFITVSGNCQNLKSGFMLYLKTVDETNIYLNEIKNSTIEGFITWLNRSKDGSAVFKKITKQHYLDTFNSIIEYLQKSCQWSTHLFQGLTLRRNVWSGEPDDRDRKQVIPSENYGAIYQACLKEIKTTMSRVCFLREQMKKEMLNPLTSQMITQNDINFKVNTASNSENDKNHYHNLGICLAALRQANPQVIVGYSNLKPLISKNLSRTIFDKLPFGGVSEIYKCFYPHSRDLVPFVIMMAIHLDYNLETLLKSNLTDYHIKENEFGYDEFFSPLSFVDANFKTTRSSVGHIDEYAEDIFISNPRKARAGGRRQEQIRPATSDPDNPAAIWRFLIEWTSMIRPLVRDTMKDRLFLFVTQSRSREIRGFVGRSTAGNDRSWRNSFENFFKDNQLDHTTFGQFRITGLDITDVVFGGDIRAKQAAGNHKNPETTYRLYSTDAQQQRGDEILAQISQVRKRWRQTDGKADPRNRPSGTDLGAATPGWHCSDPFSGPYTSDNTLCNAYGLCPTCPHGSITMDSYGCAQAWNLLKAIDDASVSISPSAWVIRWAPVKDKLLKYWLPRFSTMVLEEAKLLQLQKLPELE